MISTARNTSFEPRSQATSMLMQSSKPTTLVGKMLAETGTSPSSWLPNKLVLQALQPAKQTTSGAVVVVNAGAAIGELRRLSGLTWDQLARLFSVSRRALHFWASGKPMTSANEEHLQRLLGVLRKIDRGSASANRRELLEARLGNDIALDLLHQRRYELVVSVVGAGDIKPRLIAPKLSAKAAALRMPPAPEQLVGALQDSVHHEVGIVREGKSVRVNSDG